MIEFQSPSMPHNPDVEAGILGAILRDNDCYGNMPRMTEDMFYVPAHRVIWGLIKRQIDAGNPATPVTLQYQVSALPELKELGGSEYLGRLVFEDFSIISPIRYADILRDLYQKREILRICQESSRVVLDQTSELGAAEVRNSLENKLFQMESDSSEARTFSVTEASELALKSVADMLDGKVDQGAPTGFRGVHKVMGGLRKSDLLILAARPAMGKTSLAMNIAFNAAKAFDRQKEPQSVLFFSLEMAAEQLALRLLSDQAGIPFEKIRLGTLNRTEYQHYRKTLLRIRGLPLHIEEQPNMTVSAMRGVIRRITRQQPVGLVVLDYLQLLGAQGSRRQDNRVQELSEITRSLKILAREFHVPILALSQLSRAVENRENKTPNLADLRDSGSIEQDADQVLFLYRPEYYLKEPQAKDNEKPAAFASRMELYRENALKLAGVAKLIIAKNRHGACGSIDLHFNAQMIWFSYQD